MQVHRTGRARVAHVADELAGLNGIAVPDHDLVEVPVEVHASRASDVEDHGTVALVARSRHGAGVDRVDRLTAIAHEIQARVRATTRARGTEAIAVVEVLDRAEESVAALRRGPTAAAAAAVAGVATAAIAIA